MSNELSPAEEAMMKMTFEVSMRRAADIIDHITEMDVLDMQRELLRTGSPMSKVCRMDRAMLAAAHLRACAENGREVDHAMVRKELEAKNGR